MILFINPYKKMFRFKKKKKLVKYELYQSFDINECKDEEREDLIKVKYI